MTLNIVQLEQIMSILLLMYKRRLHLPMCYVLHMPVYSKPYKQFYF